MFIDFIDDDNSISSYNPPGVVLTNSHNFFRACSGVPDCGVADSMIISGGDAIIGVMPRIRDFVRRTPSSATMRAYPIGSDADSPRSTHPPTGAAESPGCPNDPPIALASAAAFSSAPSNPAAARLKRCALPQMPPAAASIIPSAAALTAVYAGTHRGAGWLSHPRPGTIMLGPPRRRLPPARSGPGAPSCGCCGCSGGGGPATCR